MAAVALVGGAVKLAERPDRPERDPEEKDFACHGAGAAEVVWSVPTERRAVALTFDDGPHPVLTPMVADVLAERGVRATFFVIGSVAMRSPELVRRLLDDGHELANHTWSHQPMAHVTGQEARDEVLRGAAAIERVAGVTSRWFRSPRGMLNGAVLRAAADCDQHIAMWSAKPPATLLHAPDLAAERMLEELGPGSIFLFHDGTSGRIDEDLELRRRREIPVLEALLDGLVERGYETLTLSELSASRSSGAPSPG